MSISLVTHVDQITRNVTIYQEEVRKSAGLNARIARTVWWYAIPTMSGWQFAPSKFVGYINLDASKYLKQAQSLDGRDTEKAMRDLFATVDPQSPLFNELRGALEVFTQSLGSNIGGRFKGIRVPPDVLSAIAPNRRIACDASVSARIASDPEICGGRPRIRGTRVRVSDIIEMLADGATREEIVQDYPYLSLEDIAAALAFAARAVSHAIVRAA